MANSYRMPTTFIGSTISHAMCEYEGSYIPSPPRIDGQIKASPLPGSIVQRVLQPKKYSAPVINNLDKNAIIVDFNVVDPYSKELIKNRVHRVIFADVFQNLNVDAAKNIPGLIKMKRQIDELQAQNSFLDSKLNECLHKMSNYDRDYAAQEAARMADFTAMIKKKTTSFGDILQQTRQQY